MKSESVIYYLTLASFIITICLCVCSVIFGGEGKQFDKVTEKTDLIWVWNPMMVSLTWISLFVCGVLAILSVLITDDSSNVPKETVEAKEASKP